MKTFETLLENGNFNFIPIIFLAIPIIVMVSLIRVYKKRYLYVLHPPKNYSHKEIKGGYVSKFSEIGIGIGSLIGIVLVLFQLDSFWISLCIGIGGTLGFLLDIYNFKRNNNAN